MVAMTQVQFRERALAALEGQKVGEDCLLSGPQEKILLAAYGIYAREIGRKSDKLKDEITELKVSAEHKQTELVKEQARTVIATMWNREAAKQFGSFMITPISDWGREPEVQLLEADTIEGTVADLEVVEAVVEEAGDSGVRAEGEQTDQAADQFNSNLSKLPWYLWIPTTVLSRIFGGMTPLSFSLLLMAVVAGAVLYGQHARSVWKDQYDAEVAANSNLRELIINKDAEIASLLDVRSQNEQLEISLADAQRRLDLEKQAATSLRDDLDKSRSEFAVFRAEVAEKHSAELQRFQADVSAASAQREREQTAEISQLETQLANFEREAGLNEQRIIELQSNYSSASDAERDLQEKLQELYDEHNALNRKNIEISAQLTDLQAVNRVLAGIPLAVNKYFWHQEGYLEVRRACFRVFYREQMALHADRLDGLAIPNDMSWASYDLDQDNRRLTANCSDY